MLEIKAVQALKSFSIRVPGSKSYANRALIISALANGKSKLFNVPFCDDILVTLHALKNLGVKISQKGKNLEIHGGLKKFSKPKNPLHLGNAGTAVRFLTAVLALTDFESNITGTARMKERPIKDLIAALNQLGADVTCENGCPPVKINGNGLKGGTAEIRGDISSQFISALLIAAPYAKNETTIHITKKLTSASYIDTTLDMLTHFGGTFIKINDTTFKIPPRQTYKARTYTIPADASAASYFFALAAIHGTKVTFKNITFSMQGDFQFLEVLKKMGCTYKTTKTTLSLKGPKHLRSLGKIDLNTMPDAAMTAAITAAFANGTSHLIGLHNLRFKETDRLKALETELKKIGCHVKKTKNSLKIEGNPKTLHGNIIETYNDHRMAMCFAVAGTRIQGIRIKNPACVSKTYPDFWKDLKEPLKNYVPTA